MTRVSRLTHTLLRTGAHVDPVTGEKYSWWDRRKALEKYSGREDVFCSFTNVFKLGVNPQSEYNTPIGVYGYPVDYIFRRKSRDFYDIPFPSGGKSKYVHVFQVSGMEQLLIFDLFDNHYLSLWGSVSYNLDPKQFDLLSRKIDKISDFINQTKTEMFGAPYGTPEYDNYVIKVGGIDVLFNWYRDWRARLYEYSNFKEGDLLDLVVTDDLNYVNIPNLKEHGLNISTVLRKTRRSLAKTGRPYNVIFPYEDQIRQTIPEARSMKDSKYISLKKKVLSERVVCDQAFVWNMTRHLSSGNPRRWTGMLRQLGFTGALDHDTETIHPNEPTQAVFFDMTQVRILEVVDNELPKNFTNLYTRELSGWSARPQEDRLHGVLIQVYSSYLLREAVPEGQRAVELRKSLMENKNMYMVTHDLLTDSLNYLWRYLGWLNQHGDEEWRDQVRPAIVEKLQDWLRFLQTLEPPVSWVGLVGRLSRLIQVVQKG